ncbi:hypothetical protein MHTCC0001_27840 [Flavobacteriaceae bacterium MHTCC 0001]
MYIVLYAFSVKLDCEDQFVEGWKGLTTYIYKNNGSLGSRLHKSSALNYIAYAQWPNKKIFEMAASGNLPPEAESFREKMRTACSDIKIINRFDVVEDLLADEVYD